METSTASAPTLGPASRDRKTLAALSSILLLLFSGGCTKQDDAIGEIQLRLSQITAEHATVTDQLADLAQKHESTRKEHDKHASELAALKNSMAELATALQLQHFERWSETIAYLKPGSEGYDTILTNYGLLTFDLSDVSPFANSTRVQLRVGNTSSGTLTGVTADIEYGPVGITGFELVDKTKNKTVSLGNLEDGSFNDRSIVLDGIAPHEFGFLRIKNVTIKGVGLRTAPKN